MTTNAKRQVAPFFSVVIPVYNARGYLRECLQGIEAQAFDDYEVVLVDDGSTDGSPTIEREFARGARPRVVLRAQENAGPYAARETGIAAATGRYVMFCDADDVLLPGCLERVYEALCEWECDVLAFEATTACDRTRCYFNYEPRDATYEGAEVSRLIEETATGFKHNCLWNKAIRRELLLDLDPIHPRHFGEDAYVVLQVFERARRVRLIDDCLYFYRETSSSITLGRRPIPACDVELSQDKMAEVLARWNRADSAALAFADKGAWLCAKVVESILGTGLIWQERRRLLDELRVCRFAQKAVRDLSVGGILCSARAPLMRADLKPFVTLLGARRYHALAVYSAMLAIPRLLHRRLAGRSVR